MNFETKFNIGDHVFFMENNVPTEAVISAIEIFYVNTNQDRTKYSARKVANSVSWIDYQHLLEQSLFKSRGELLSSLFGGTICKGRNCTAINGSGHSVECISEHDQCFDAVTQEVIPGTKAALSRLRIGD